jgi:hypothetical protein
MPLIQTYGGDSVRAYGDFTKNLVLATGGDTISYYNGYIYHTFLNNGTFKLKTAKNADILVVGGGGGAGSQISTMLTSYGGGAGAVQYFSNQSLSTTSYDITVGNGGSGGSYTSGATGSNGSSSQFGSLTAALGGGGGGASGGQQVYSGASATNGTTGSNGGSGGGGSPGGSGTQGNSGNAGGGGGAGTSASSTAAGAGALYADWAIASGLSLDSKFAGGGGSSDVILISGGGGSGGGPAPYGGAGNNGTNGVGGGGGAPGKSKDSYQQVGNGGKGVVIVRYSALYSGQTVKLTPGAVPTNTAIPTFEWGGGNLGPGYQIRKSSDGTWNNADSLEYKWQYSNDGSLWGDRTSWSSTYSHFMISGATDLVQPWQYFTSYPNKTMASYSYPQNLAGSSDQGLYYRLAVRALNSNGYSDPAYSTASNQIPLIPTYQGGASFSGSVTAGSTVTVNNIGSWSRLSQSGYYYFQFALLQNSSFATNPSSIQSGVSDVNGNLAIGWSRGNSYAIPSYFSGFGIYLGCYITPYQDAPTGLSSLNTASGAFLYLGRVP